MCCRKKSSSCLLVGLACVIAVSGQYKLEQPVLIGKDQGLPTNDVRFITKGNDGFMWLATAQGISRFDGHQVKTFRLNGTKQTAFFDNMINTVLPIGNEIWAGTHHGVSVLNTNDETFRHYQLAENGKSDSIARRFDQSVVVLYSDRQGDLWLGTREKGAWLYDKKKDDFRKFSYPADAYTQMVPSLGTGNSILSIEASRTNDSIVWVGTVAGLQEINKYSGQVRWYTYPQVDKDYQVAVNAFRRMCHADDGLLYVGSWGAGINVFDPVKKTFTPIALKSSAGKDIIETPISRIRRKSTDEIWITAGAGLAVYNFRKQEITSHYYSELLKHKFYGVDYIDESNRIWHANINGIQYFDPAVQQFTNYSFDHLYGKEFAFAFYIIPDASGNELTICPRQADGLYLFNKSARQWKRLPFNTGGRPAYNRITVRGFEEMSSGKYIISADEGLFVFSLHTGQISVAPNQPHVSFKQWGEVKKDRAGNLWLSADADGMIRWNPGENKSRVFKNELTPDRSGIGFGRLVNMFIDSRNNVWFARAGGFSVYDAVSDSILNFLYHQNNSNSFPNINSFGEDAMGRIWIASGDGWYGYIDMKNLRRGIVRKFDLREKKISGYINFLATDNDGNVWGDTDKELVRINSSDLSITTFSFDYGVKVPDFFQFVFLPSGEMAFGGRNSITLADPKGLQRNKELPDPYIAQLRILNNPVTPSSYDGGKLDLSYRQNFFTVYFSAKAYTMPEGIRFRYRLKEFDDWAEASDNRLANYTNVPPGNYVFQLQAANNEGTWNEKLMELPVHIITPWWRTLWFRIALVLFLAFITYRLYRYRIDQVKKKEKLRTQYEKKLANVEMTALLAQMNPHFLFNSLNSIDSYIIRNESGKASEYLNNFARLIRLILQNSRSNYISLKDELETLDLYLQMESLRFKDKFQYEINVPENLDTAALVIPPMLIQPYVENAIWHGLMHKKDGSPGKVSISVTFENNNLICRIEDNGIGREKAQELKKQKPGNRKRSMAMQITNERIEMINKLYDTNTSVEVIDLHGDEGRAMGTRVELIIPV